jgi:hypothetical protein
MHCLACDGRPYQLHQEARALSQMNSALHILILHNLVDMIQSDQRSCLDRKSFGDNIFLLCHWKASMVCQAISGLSALLPRLKARNITIFDQALASNTKGENILAKHGWNGPTHSVLR